MTWSSHDEWYKHMPLTRGQLRSMSAASLEDFNMDSDQLKIFFLEALSDDTVVKKQQAVLMPVFDCLSKALEDIGHMNQHLRKRLDEKDAEIGALHKQVAAREQKIDAMEPWERKGSIRIQGLSEDTSGSVEEKVLDLFNKQMKLRPPLAMEDIKVANRLPGGRARQAPAHGNIRRGSSPGENDGERNRAGDGNRAGCGDNNGESGDGRGDDDGDGHDDGDGQDDGSGSDQASRPLLPRSVIVKSVSRRCKSRVMSERKKLKGLKGPRPIYIQNDLTTLRAKIAYKEHQLRNEGKLNDTWVFDSRVLVEDLHNHIKQVNCLNDLNIY